MKKIKKGIIIFGKKVRDVISEEIYALGINTLGRPHTEIECEELRACVRRGLKNLVRSISAHFK